MRTRVGVLAEVDRLAALRPLMEAYAERGFDVQRVDPVEDVQARIATLHVDAVLAVTPPRRSARTMLDGPTVPGASGLVPVGIVPDSGDEALRTFATAAAAVQRRAGGGAGRTVALLAQRTPRYRDLTTRLERTLARGGDDVRCLRWTADELVREDLLRGLGLGLAAAIYTGHGRPKGWAAYRGVRAHHFDGAGLPLATVFSLTCNTASRYRTGLSFSEAVVLGGGAASALGAVRETQHRRNARWVIHLAHELARPGVTIGQVARSAARLDGTGRLYRIFGDPLAPLADDPGGGARAERYSQEVILSWRERSA